MTPGWSAQAACRAEDPELFFPPPNGDTLAAKRVCARCPVRRDCLLDSFRTYDVDWGIRGGMATKERRYARERWLAGDLSALDMAPLPTASPSNALAEVTDRDLARLHRRLRRVGDCLLWIGGVDSRGHGLLVLHRGSRRFHPPAHRVAFAEHYGRQPEGNVAQTCGNRRCCEGAHLTDVVIREEVEPILARAA